MTSRNLNPNKLVLVFTSLILVLLSTSLFFGYKFVQLTKEVDRQNATIQDYKARLPMDGGLTEESSFPGVGKFVVKRAANDNLITILDSNGGSEKTVLRIKGVTVLPVGRDNWSHGGDYFFIQTIDYVKNLSNVYLFKSDGSAFPSGQNYLETAREGLNGQYFTSVNWAGGGGFIGNFLYISKTPSGSIDNILIDANNAKLIKSLPPESIMF